MLQYTDLMDFYYKISFNAHALAHFLIGGSYGRDLFNKMTEVGVFGSTSSATFVSLLLTFPLKGMYRDHYIVPRSGCVVNETDYLSSTCGFDCVDGQDDNVISGMCVLCVSVVCEMCM